MATGSTTSASAVLNRGIGTGVRRSLGGRFLFRPIAIGAVLGNSGLFIGRAVLGAGLVGRARQAAIGVLDPLGLAAQGALMGDDDARRAAGDRIGGLLALFRRAGALVDLDVPLQQVARTGPGSTGGASRSGSPP